MSTALEIILWTVVILYSLLLLLPLIGFLSRKENAAGPGTTRSVAVIVAARNEEKTITALLESLERQQDAAPFEVVVVNDESTDQTFFVAENYAKRSKLNIRVIDSEGVGKKAALATGIHLSGAEIILMTDADCIVGENWISSFRKHFANERIELVAGLVTYAKTDSWLRDVLETEMIFLQVVSAGLFHWGKPAMCNGANMGFTWEFFMRNKGFQDDIFFSGDDIFLLQKAMARGAHTVAWNCDPGAMVSTKPASSVSEAITQRQRWLSKIKGYTGGTLLFTGPLFLAVQLLLPAAVIAFFVYGTALNPFTAVFTVKTLVELLLLSLAVPFFGEQKVLLKFPAAVVIYHFISLCAAGMSLQRNVVWKGRNWRNGNVK
ncbi:MAG TPA: glycosyltransferase [Bacteroidia bacterium]|nr:glycosyltransferase [Bacteroidia bacterium]